MDSEPQMPVSRGFVTTQSGWRKPGSSISTSLTGVRASALSRRLSVSGLGCGSGSTPKISARMGRSVWPEPVTEEE